MASESVPGSPALIPGLIRRFALGLTLQAVLAVVPITFLLLFPSPWMSLGFAAVIGLFGCRWIALGSPLPETRVNLLILLFLAATLAGLLHSSAPDLAVLTAGQLVASVTIFFVLQDKAKASSDLWHATAVLAILGILFALAAPFTVNWSPDKVYDIPVFYKLTWPQLPKVTNSNILAGGLAVIAPIVLALVMQPERRGRLLGAVSFASIGVMLVLLQSRGALFALGVGLAVWIILYNRWFLALIPIGLLGALYINQVSGGPPPAQFLYGKIGTVTGGSLTERQDLWFQALYLIRQSPLVGIGLGAYERIAPYAWPYSLSQPSTLIEPHAHNLFLQVALDTGLFGLAAFTVLIFVSFSSAWRAWRSRVEPHLAIAVIAALTVVVVHGLGDTIVWGTAKPSIVLWIVLGLATRLEQLRREQGSRQSRGLRPDAAALSDTEK